jgi:hypothetical protein
VSNIHKLHKKNYFLLKKLNVHIHLTEDAYSVFLKNQKNKKKETKSQIPKANKKIKFIMNVLMDQT